MLPHTRLLPPHPEKNCHAEAFSRSRFLSAMRGKNNCFSQTRQALGILVTLWAFRCGLTHVGNARFVPAMCFSVGGHRGTRASVAEAKLPASSSCPGTCLVLSVDMKALGRRVFYGMGCQSPNGKRIRSGPRDG